MEDNALILASKNGNLDTVTSLLIGGYSVHLRDKDDATPLYWSACRGHAEVCQELLRHKSDVNAQVKWGSTALHAACDRNHMECVKLLIKSGASLDTQNSRGDTALHLTAYRGYTEVVKLLIRAHANIFIKNDKGKTAADEADGNRQHGVAQILSRRMKEMLSRASSHDSDQPILSCPESLGMALRNEIRKDISIERNVSDFVRYNGQVTDFTRPSHRNSTGHIKSNLSIGQGDIPQNEDNLNNYQGGCGVNKGHQNKLFRRRTIHSDFRRNVSYLNGHQSPTESIDIDPRDNSSELDACDANGICDTMKPECLQNQTEGTLYELSSQSSFTSELERKCSGRSVHNGSDNGNKGLKEYAEMLQMKIVSSNEELSVKDKEIRELNDTVQTMKQQIGQYQFLCRKMYEEKMDLIKKLKESEEEIKMQRRVNEDILRILNSPVENKPQISFCREPVQADIMQQVNSQCILRPTHTHLEKYFLSCRSATSEQSQQTLKDHVKTRWVSHNTACDTNCQMYYNATHTSGIMNTACGTNESADSDEHRHEWVSGIDYTLSDNKPMYKVGSHGRYASLSFDINRQGSAYVLQMMIPSLSSGARDPNVCDFHQSLHHSIMTKLSHPNLLHAVHHYMGSVDSLSNVIKTVTQVPCSLAPSHKTSFLVVERYLHSLKSFLQQSLSGGQLHPTFLCVALYQLLSAVHFLQKNGIVHRDIDPGTILMDKRLRPVFSNFDMALRLHDEAGQAIVYTHPNQIEAGKNHVMAPELVHYKQNGPPCSPTKVTLKQIYGKTDSYAVGIMMQQILSHTTRTLQPSCNAAHGFETSVTQPSYDFAQPIGTSITHSQNDVSLGLDFVLQNLTKDDPLERMSARKALINLGMLIFLPSMDDICSKADVEFHCQARMLKLLSFQREETVQSNFCTQEQSMEWLKPEIEADFLSSCSPGEFWEVYQCLKQRVL